MTLFAWSFFPSFVLSLLLTGVFYFILKRRKIEQVERAEGPLTHREKSGTPTMGGLGFILIAAVTVINFVDLRYIPVLLLFLGFSAVGFVDDLLKILNKRNLGLTFWQKIMVQTALAAAFSIYIGGPLHYILFIMFIIVGTGNATNLTDGLDGLLSGTSILAFLSFAFIAFRSDLLGGASFAFIFTGAIAGFLPYNFPKAKMFMGDTGSLGIGAALAGLAVIMHKELLLALVGGLFLAEALSVIIQVGSFKLRQKRVFKMAPLHHHFELSGLSELKVVLMFWLIQLVLSVAGVLIS